MKTRLISTMAMAACPALSLFAYNDYGMEETIMSIIMYIVGFFVFFFLIKYFFDKNNPDIDSKWIIALPLFHTYSFTCAMTMVANPRAAEIYRYYIGENDSMGALFLLFGYLIGGVVAFTALYTLYRILKHKTKPFGKFPSIMLYCSIALTIFCLILSYQFHEIDKVTSMLLGVSFADNSRFFLVMVILTWGLQYRFKESVSWIIHDGTSTASTSPANAVGNTKQCPYCGETILAVAKKCKYCGEWIKEEDMPKRQVPCPICGELVDEGTELCPHCKESITLPTVEKVNDSQPAMDFDNSENISAGAEEDNYRTLYMIIAALVGIPILIFIVFLVVALVSGNSMSSSSDAGSTEYPDSAYSYDEYPDSTYGYDEYPDSTDSYYY